QAMLGLAGRNFMPETTVVYNDPAYQADICELVPGAAGQQAVDGRATSYICENFSCRQPVHTLEDLARMLEQHSTNARS
ncbi:MAG: hypothetical protein ACRDBM_07985, partial [Sporomusa sp.]